MWVRSAIELLLIALLIVGVFYEKKLITFEKDIQAIYHACKRQGITFFQFIKLLFEGITTSIDRYIKKVIEK